MFDPYAHFERASLSNGIPVFLHNVPDCGYAYVDFVFRVGAQHDDVDRSGLAHFVEHLVCANSPLDLTARKKFFAELGGGYHVFTSYFATCYGFKLPVSHRRFDEALAFWAEATLGGRLVDHFDREKSVIESEIRRKYQSVETMRFETKLNQLMYSGTFRALAPSPAGTLESLSQITLEEAQCFHRKHYIPANLSVVCVGDISLPNLLEKLEANLGQYVGGATTLSFPPQSEIPLRTEFRMEYQDSNLIERRRATINLHTLLPATIPSDAVSIVARVISGVLTTELRDKRGLVYNTGAGSGTMGFCNSLSIGAEEFGIEHLRVVEQVLRETITLLPKLYGCFLEEKKIELLRYAMYDVPWFKVQESVVGDLAMFGRLKTRQEEYDECLSLTLKDWVAVTEYLQDEKRVFTSIIYK